MSIIINGVEIPNTGNIIYNGVDLDKVIYNGVVVWEKYVEPIDPPTKEIDYADPGFWTNFVQQGGSGSSGMMDRAGTFGLYGRVSEQSDWFTPYYRTKDLIDCSGYSKLEITVSSSGSINSDDGWHNNRLIVKKGSHVTSGNDSNAIILTGGTTTYEFDVANQRVSIAVGIDCKLPFSGSSFIGLISMILYK